MMLLLEWVIRYGALLVAPSCAVTVCVEYSIVVYEAGTRSQVYMHGTVEGYD